MLAWIVAVSGSYVMNSLTTFARESGRKLRWQGLFQLLVSQVAGLVANTATGVRRVLFHAGAGSASCCAIGASFLVNFSLSHFVVFRKRRQPIRS